MVFRPAYAGLPRNRKTPNDPSSPLQMIPEDAESTRLRCSAGNKILLLPCWLVGQNIVAENQVECDPDVMHFRRKLRDER